MERIRLATKEEVESIKAVADLSEGCLVLALTTQSGVPLAAIRTVVEADPMIFPADFPDRLKAVFVRDIETTLAAKGAPFYYFNIAASDEAWQKVALGWGAEQVSPAPEIRFKKSLG